MSEFKLIMENENLAAWMAINNAFTRPPLDLTAPKSWCSSGLMFQLGRYVSLATGDQMTGFGQIIVRYESPATGDQLKRFGKIIERGEGGDLVLSRRDFELKRVWINVKTGVPGGREAPMTRDKLRNLKLDGDIWPLHEYFNPYKGGITVWPGNGYVHEAEPTDDLNILRKHTFRFQRDADFTVEIDVGGETAAVKDISEIVVLKDEGLPDDIRKNPPQRPK